MKALSYYKTAVGEIGLVEEDGAITDIFFCHEQIPEDLVQEETILIKKAVKQLEEYFEGKRIDFDLPLFLKGTPFQLDVWEALSTIPYGETRSYKQIAKQINNPKASRAVGLANNRNPISIVIPCHRVIGADGKLVGYGGGLAIKEYLLEMEKKYYTKLSLKAGKMT